MSVIDADAHVAESPVTFDDKYLDPAYRARRPQVVDYGGRPHWLVDYQVFPRFSGPGPHSSGSPTRAGDVFSVYNKVKSEPVESQELTDAPARLRDMDREGIDLQVLYPTMFLAHHLSPDPAYMAALCACYNRWLGDATSGYPGRLKWAAVVNLADPLLAAAEVRQARRLGALAVMIPGTAGDLPLHHPSLMPFFEAAAEEALPVAVHVAWSSPSLDRLATELYYSTLVPFSFSLLTGFVSILGSGLLDRFPDLRVAFLEGGCQWVHFLQDRMDHRFAFIRKMQAAGLPVPLNGAQERAVDYLRKGNVYVSIEVEDQLLPQVVDLMGASQLLFGSDMPHADREPHAAATLRAREDLTPAQAEMVLDGNPRRFYGL